jgi:hypothetical protein
VNKDIHEKCPTSSDESTLQKQAEDESQETEEGSNVSETSKVCLFIAFNDA